MTLDGVKHQYLLLRANVILLAGDLAQSLKILLAPLSHDTVMSPPLGVSGRPVAVSMKAMPLLTSTAAARSASYAGADVARMALTLVEEQADEVVAQLYADYCSKAGLGAPAKPAPKKP